MGIFGMFSKKTTRKENMNNSEELDQEYGKLFLQLLNEKTRDDAYDQLALMEDRYPEAGVVVGQRFEGEEARKHFKKAADANIAEGHWGICGTIEHSYVPNPNNEDDADWEKHCLVAAEGGCADACLEMGNVCHRRKWYAESAYWYEMALCYGHPDAEQSINGINREWQSVGKPEKYVGTKNFTKSRYNAAIIMMKVSTGEKMPNAADKLMPLALEGENMAGFLLTSVFEEIGNYEMAYKVYQSLSTYNNPHALRCLADTLLVGNGTNKDPESAYQLYKRAADGGNAAAMFIMGEKARTEKNKYLAACWYGKAYVRGMNMAIQRLREISNDFGDEISKVEEVEVIVDTVNRLPYKEKWESINVRLKEEMYGKTSQLPQTKIASDILVKLMNNHELDKEPEVNKAYNKAYNDNIELSNSTEFEPVYLCCRRMADLGLVLNYGPAAVWLGMFCEEVLEDYNDARNWYNKAAGFGEGIGMYRVGLLYLNKKVALPNSVSLERCFTDAAAHGVPEAKAIIDKYFSK